MLINASYFDDTACSSIEAKARVSGTIAVGELIVLASGISAHKITRKIDSFKIAYYTEVIISSLNTHKMCGYENWSSGEFKDATSCEFFSIGIAELTKDIIQIENNTLRYGDYDYIGESGYPTQLESESFTKK